MTLTRTAAAELLHRHGLAPSRVFGQNFVVDPNTVRRIVRLARVGIGDKVVEIGPGLGSLTLALTDAGAHVVAVEIDHGLVGVLAEVIAGRDVTIVEADALEMRWPAMLEGLGWHLVANLPYNVATPLVIEVLERVPAVSEMIVMVQREVGERFAAKPRTAAYGGVSVKIANFATASIIGKIPPTVFLPQPKVESALVRIVRHDRTVIDDLDHGRFVDLVNAGFGKRRKMLRGSLAGRVTAEQLEHAGIRPESRAEELSVDDWARLVDEVRP